MDLFADQLAEELATNHGLRQIPIIDGELWFQPQLPLSLTSDAAMQRLREETAWRAETIQVWGKQHLQPRLMAWHGDASYRYSGKTFHPEPFTPLQLMLKQAVEQATGRRFNSVLLNYYRNERDSMGFHADDEPELGPQPAIASLSFGASRTFILKHRHTGQRLKLALGDGALLLMAGSLQQHWQHGINKQSRPCGERINLTFRNILRAP